MRSESVCVSLENGRATTTMAIRMPMLSLSQARPFCRNGLSLKLSKIARFCKKKNSCKCRSVMVGGGARS